MAEIPSSVRKQVYKRDAVIDEYGYKDEDYVYCIGCGSWHPRSDMNKGIHHIDSNRSNNELYNLATLCNKCHRVVHSMSIKMSEKVMIVLSIYRYMLKLYVSKMSHYRKYLNIDKIPDAEKELKLEDIGGLLEW